MPRALGEFSFPVRYGLCSKLSGSLHDRVLLLLMITLLLLYCTVPMLLAFFAAGMAAGPSAVVTALGGLAQMQARRTHPDPVYDARGVCDRSLLLCTHTKHLYVCMLMLQSSCLQSCTLYPQLLRFLFWDSCGNIKEVLAGAKNSVNSGPLMVF